MTARRSWFDFGLREMLHYRELMRVLALRDVKLRYRQTALGVAGVVIGPLLNAGILTFLFGEVAGLKSEGKPYLAVTYAGFLAWNVFATLVGRSSSVLLSNSALVNKTYVPRLLLPASGIFVAMVDFAIGSFLMAGVMLFFRLAPSPAILLVPLWVTAIAALGLGIGTAFAAAMVHYRDVGLATNIVLQSLLYLTPVAYISTAVPERFQLLYTLNPLAALVQGFRWSVLGTTAPSVTRTIVSMAACLVALMAGCVIFTRLERGLADVL